MVWGHPRGTDPALTLATGLEHDVVEPGSHVMFDCHGTIDLYCWDGGKTWVVSASNSRSSSVPRKIACRFSATNRAALRSSSRFR
jgi:hypothetical protein